MEEVRYSAFEKIFHAIALGCAPIARASFELDQILSIKSRSSSKSHEHPIFVSGVARSGTTAILNALAATGKFRSLTYRDMPFVLMPILWSRLSQPFRSERGGVQRAHKDSIVINYDSPEAFEEVFWRSFCGPDYIFSTHLAPHIPRREVIEKFQLYVTSLLNNQTTPS